MSVRVADDVAWVEVQVETDAASEPEVAAALVPHGPPLLMRGSAALIWLVLAEPGLLWEGEPATREEVVDRVAEASGQPAEAVAADVHALLDDLLGRGLLTCD